MGLHGRGQPLMSPFDNAPPATLCVSNLLLNQGFLFMVYLTMLSGAKPIQRRMFESLVNSGMEHDRQCMCEVTMCSLCIAELHVTVQDIKILTAEQQCRQQ
jgi:hypothetical protein